MRHQARRALDLLLDNHGRLVPHKAINRAIWPDGAGTKMPGTVQDHRGAIMWHVRRALADQGLSLRNVHGIGYVIPRPLTARPPR
jgi:DNA-binding response OmpR family regulator